MQSTAKINLHNKKNNQALTLDYQFKTRFNTIIVNVYILSILAPRVWFEQTTYRLTAGCSTAELTRNIIFLRKQRYIIKLKRYCQQLL